MPAGQTEAGDTGRLVVPTCIGCGAMSVFGSCEQGCAEQRLDLVGADSLDELVASRSALRRHIERFRGIAQELAARHLGEDECQAAYRHLQTAARAALREHPAGDLQAVDEPARMATTWWCPRCGGLEAPQPCLGVCLWRPVEWVPRKIWEEEREQARAERDAEAELRQLLRRLVFITPREGRWEAGWRALSVGARDVLARTPVD